MALSDRLAKDVRRVRVLTIDIENAPTVAKVWGQFNQNVSLAQIVEPGRIISFAAKFLGEKPVYFSEWDHGHDNMIREAHRLLSECDVAISYNGNGFDFKNLNWEFARLGLPRPRPYKSIDLLGIARREFRPYSRKLDFVASQLGLGNKVEHEGFDLWNKVLSGDADARRRFRKYNIQDVVLTEKLYVRLLPWVPANANLPLIVGETRGCPNCGSTKLHMDGSTYTAQTAYALYQCKRCGAWSRSNVVRSRTSRRIVR